MPVTTDPIHVLHVDDDPDFTDLAATFLEREDDRIAVRTADCAEAGLAALADHDVDCVVSDYDMPGRNGIEFLEAVRAEYPDHPFILFTGKGSEEVASDAISAGVTDYLQKEVGADQYAILANRIRNSVDRTRAERDRRRQLRAIETANEGISILDEDGRFVYVNESYADLYGYDGEEMVGEHWALIYPDGNEARIREDVLPTVHEEGHWRGETTGLRADGSTFTEDHTLATTDRGELVCTVRDITDRERRERRFEAVFQNTHTFIGLLDPDGTLLEANETALSFGGFDREDVVGDPLWEAGWVRPIEESRAAVREGVQRAREGDLFRQEIRAQGVDREAVLDFSVRPVTDDDGEVTLLVPEGRDVTERKRHLRRLETLVDNLPGMVYRCENGRGWPMEHVGGEVERLTGYQPRDIESREGFYGSEIVHPDDREEVWTTVQNALDARERFELTYRITTADGTTKRVWERGQGVYEDGEVAAIEGFVTDVRDRERQ